MGFYAVNEVVVKDSYGSLDIPFDEGVVKLTVQVFDNDILIWPAENEARTYTFQVENEARLYKGFNTVVPVTPWTGVRVKCAIPGGTARVTLRAYW